MCVSVCGTDNVLYGSDYPHTIGDMAGCLSRVDALPDLHAGKSAGLERAAHLQALKGGTMNRFLGLAAALMIAGSAAAQVINPVGPDKVVYHLSAGLEQASDGLRNIRNHLEVNPKAHIVVVAHARGVDYLMKGAKDKNGNPYDVAVEQLVNEGVQFDVCEITLRSRKLKRDQFIPEAVFVPSGVAEITRLQAREGYAYLRP